MDIDLLYIFARVAEAKSINKVSDDLLLTQPAISKKIKQLEIEFNTTLFVRSYQGMFLTTEGKKLYSKTIPFLKNYESLRNSVGSANINYSNINIGVLDSISSYKYADFFTDNLNKFNNIIISNKIFDLIDPFNQGQLDTLVLDSAFKEHLKGDFSEKELFLEPYYVVYAKNNQHINPSCAEINPHELQSMNLIMYPKYCPIHQRIIQTYKNIELSPPQITEIDYSESTISMVTNSDFVTVLPESMAKNKVSQNQTKLISKKLDITFMRKVSLFSRSKQKLDYLNKIK